MNYNECVEYIENANLYGAKKDDLSNIKELLSRFDNPHKRIKFVHVAGTNGKGSTCAMIESVLRCSGYKTGLFTSPYLETFTERIRINGKNVNEVLFCNVASTVIEASKQMVIEGFLHPTFFEMVTACAFIVFLSQKVDVAIIEVGVGGLYDTTNIIVPDLSVITNIGLDHITVLGGTIEEIAIQKAGIMKPGCPVVIYPQDLNIAYAQLLYQAKQTGSPVYSVADAKISVLKSGLKGQELKINYQGLSVELELGLIGRVQIFNAASALVSCLVLNGILGYQMNISTIKNGFSEAVWPGRFEIIRKENPLIIIDGAHNLQAAKKLSEEMERLLPANKYVLLIGVSSSKDVTGIVRELIKNAVAVVCTMPDLLKSVSSKELSEIASEFCENVYDIQQTALALDKAIDLAKSTSSPLLAAGSLYLAGKVRSMVIR